MSSGEQLEFSVGRNFHLDCAYPKGFSYARLISVSGPLHFIKIEFVFVFRILVGLKEDNVGKICRASKWET